jgi:PTS system N-acetylglucosamine-specific IIC component
MVEVGEEMRIMYVLQKIGRSLMIPIAVLPAASILLRIGKIEFTQPLLIKLARVCESGGSAIIDNLPLLFAIGIAIGLTSGEGVAALSATVGYLVFDNVLKHFNDMGIGVAAKLDMGVMGGIFCGMITATFYRRFHDIQLPHSLGFFGGKRFVPLITSMFMVVFGVVMGFIWPPVQGAISQLSLWVVHAGNSGIFVYGFLNRLLIPTGLHHIINNLAWFQIGVYSDGTGRILHGDISRFFAGDPTAGSYMTGFYPVMMFGLPAAALAMTKNVHPTNRKLFVPVLVSAGFTSFLTGVTEPIEFAFMFVSPVLYLVHAFLTACSMVVMNMLQVKVGFGFSAGLIDLFLSWGLSTKPYVIFLVGPAYFAIYYFTFRAFIQRFYFDTPGREGMIEKEEVIELEVSVPQMDRAASILHYIGGPINIVSVDACITRLRLLVKDESQLNDGELQRLGAIGIIRLGKGNVHLVFGTESEQIRESLKPLLRAKLSNGPLKNGGSL